MEAPICPYCEEPIQQDQMKAQAPCGNLFHTPCFLYLRPQRNGHIHECEPCFALFYPDDEEVVEEEEQTTEIREENRISNLYDTNEAFRKDIKKYITSLRGLSKPKKAFQQLVTAKKTELQPQYAQMKALYEGLYNTKKNEIMTSREYKEYRTADSRTARYYHLLRDKYNINRYSLHILRQKRGCKSIRRPRGSWRYTPQYIIRRALRLRLPWW